MRNHWQIDATLSLGEALRQWESQAAVGRRPRTLEYNRRLVTITRKAWADAMATPCDAITSEDVARFAAAVGHYSASQFNHLVNLVRAIVPAACFLRRKRERPKVVLLPAEDRFRGLLSELDAGRSSIAGLVARLLACTGLRISEATALTAEDVLPAGLLVRDSKSHRARLVPWIGECREVVEKLLVQVNGDRRLIRAKGIRRALKGACKRAGVARFSHHDFRRLFATRCIESRVDLPTAARWLGHSDGGALLGRTYFHLLDEHSANMAARVKI